MKNLYCCRIPVLYFFTLIMAACFSSCQNNQANTDRIDREEEEGESMTDYVGALEYEFNMLKNPFTGRIPEGIRDLELAQAHDILMSQGSRIFGIASNSYIYQGPGNLGGRTRSIIYDVDYNGTSNQVIYAGGVSGGLFKSTDNGASWVRKSPTNQLYSVTSIAENPLPGRKDTLYYTTGEASGNSAALSSNGGGALYGGDGVYRSADRGETWTRLANSNPTALETFSDRRDFISKVIVNPVNGQVYIAAIAGIYRSTDGGATWTLVLSGPLANNGQMTDIVVTSTGRFYAGFGGTNTAGSDGVWTSTSGDPGSWTRIAGPAGTPTGWDAGGTYGRVVLGLAPSDENMLYALYWDGSSNASCPTANTEAKLFKWNQGTTTWTDYTSALPDEPGCSVGNDPFAVQGGYDLIVSVHPESDTMIFIGGTNIYRLALGPLSPATATRIGGYASPAGYALYTNSHSDIHAIAFSPANDDIMLCGDDGGIQRTLDNKAATVSWTQVNTDYRTYQYYKVAIDPRTGNDKVIGGAQDNGCTRNIGGTGSNYEQVYSGDGGAVGLTRDIAGSTYEFVTSQQGDIRRRNSTSALGSTTNIRPTTAVNSGLFVTYFYNDPDNTDTLYYASDSSLYRYLSAHTATNVSGWTEMTGVGTAAGNGVASSNYITALATTRGPYSSATSSLFIGTNDSKVLRLDDPAVVPAGTAPVNISSGLPAGYISSIAVNPRNDDTVLVTFSNYGIVNIWWTGNANSATPTWTNVERNVTLPSARSSAIAIVGSNIVYFVGTSIGLLATTNPLTTDWVQEGATQLGNAVVTSLALRTTDNTLLVGTHGYGMWKTVLTLAGLPVTLTDFSGALQNKNALLHWSTSMELNSKQFELERSTDGISFRKIAVVPAAGNSDSRLDYSYLDRSPLAEYNYYRLKTVDIDGNFKFSNSILIKAPLVPQGITVLANPFRDDITVQLAREPKGKPELRLFDMNGRLVASQQFGQGEQMLKLAIPGEKLGSGTYVLRATIDGSGFASKVVKQ
jgi:hypothetical protein